MDLLEKPNSNEKNNIESSTTNEDVLVVLQTENGEQIALPMSALPSDFVPGDSGQIIMVESALDEQQQEIVVESTDITSEPSTSSENFVSLQQAEPTISTQNLSPILSFPTTITTNNNVNDIKEEPTNAQDQSTNLSTKPSHRTYSKSDVVKSYAPTCGTTRIYQQQSQSSTLTSNQISNQTTNSINIEASNFNNVNNDNLITIHLGEDNTIKLNSYNPTNDDLTNSASDKQTESPVIKNNPIPEIPIVKERKPKQKRKETLLTRPLNEEDLKMEFQIIEEPSPSIHDNDIRKRPRKEYRTKKKVRLEMEKLSKSESIAEDSSKTESNLLTKRLNEDDSETESQKIEESSPLNTDNDTKKSPSKEYRNKKKIKLEMDKSKEECSGEDSSKTGLNLLNKRANSEEAKIDSDKIEESSPLNHNDIRKRPGKEYRTKKKVILEMDKSSKEESLSEDSSKIESPTKVNDTSTKMSDSLRRSNRIRKKKTY